MKPPNMTALDKTLIEKIDRHLHDVGAKSLQYPVDILSVVNRNSNPLRKPVPP
ncbi:hypothetical protein CSIRO_3852 [Bradyrhizobiaceae bacterium SG-6C]|nr:hypothetical protein CSIRO_3852 [Bradyrhizobiaceae bacterium SG-6C]